MPAAQPAVLYGIRTLIDESLSLEAATSCFSIEPALVVQVPPSKSALLYAFISFIVILSLHFGAYLSTCIFQITFWLNQWLKMLQKNLECKQFFP